MTYCVGMLCRDGIVGISDSRTNAGMDHLSIHRKMRIFEERGERVICLMTSGNLSVSQSVFALIDQDLKAHRAGERREHLLNQPSLYETARYVGHKIRMIRELDKDALRGDGYEFEVSMLLGGQIIGEEKQLWQVYPQGNPIRAGEDTPFLQIGELKYGKPILDRSFTYENSLEFAVKCGLLSMDSSSKSNVSVGPPFDIFVYESDAFEVRQQVRMNEHDPYFVDLRRQWQERIVALIRDLPEFTLEEKKPAIRPVCVDSAAEGERVRGGRS